MDKTLLKKELLNPNNITVWIGLIAALYVARDVIGVGFPQSLFTMICVMAFLLSSIEDSLCVYIFTVALTLPGNEIRLAYFVIFLLKQKGVIRRFKSLNFFVIFVLINELIVSYYYYSGSKYQFIYNYIVYALYLLIPVLWSQYIFSQEALVSAIKSFILGVLLASIISMFLAVRQSGWAVVLSGSYSLGRIATEYMGNSSMITTNNRNGLAIQAVTVISFITILLSKKKIKPIPSIVALVILLTIVLLTRSRTGVVLLAMLLTYWILVITARRGNLVNGILIIGCIGILIIGLHYFFPSAWNGVYARFVNQADITNGRNALSVLYLEKWKENAISFMFGYGRNTYFDILRIDGVPHNMFVDVLTCSGLAGLVCIMVWLYRLLRGSLANVEKEQIPYAILTPLLYFISTMAGQYLTVAITHTVFSFLLLSTAAIGQEGKK